LPWSLWVNAVGDPTVPDGPGLDSRTVGDEAIRRKHPVVRAVAAAVMVALPMALAVVVTGSPAHTWTTWIDPRTGVAGRYPADWHLQSFDDNLGLATHTGMVFSNVAHHFEYPDLPEGRATSAWDYEDLPDDAVVIEVSQTVRLSILCKRTTLPLSLDDGQLSRDRPSYGAPPRLFIPACIEGRNGIGVHVLFFPETSARDRLAARTFVESIGPLDI
jgi:hypothetical protein